jgi:acetolactate synthase-1/2/3 large subunit
MAEEAIGIGRPDLDFVALSRGMGVPATRATTPVEFDAQFREALAAGGPRLIEAVLVS